MKQDLGSTGIPGTVRIAAAAFAACFLLLGAMAPALAEKRSLKLFNTHTHETVTITYKKNGKFIPSALRELNRFLRDWRRNEATKMDPELFDLIWDVYRKSGASKPIHVVSGYRSPATNNLLRSRSRGVARKSQHMRGKAMDFFIPGVSIKKLRATGLRKEVGGVGYYPKSGSPFVHMDTARVRHWPRMTRKQLAQVFPDGKTIHVPSDGKPMPRYKQALAELKRRDARYGNPAFARERKQEKEDDDEVQVAALEKTKPARTAARQPVAATSRPVPDDDSAVLTPRARNNANPFTGIVSRLTNSGNGKTPPGDIPAANAPAPADEPPVAVAPQAAPVIEAVPQPEPDAPVIVATTPLAKPARAMQNLVAEAPRIEPAADAKPIVVASADTAPAILPPAGPVASSQRQPATASATPAPEANVGPVIAAEPVPASTNPADFMVASLPPRTRSFVSTADPVEAANGIIESRLPPARPLIDTEAPPIMAYANASSPLVKPDVADHGIVGSVPRPQNRTAAEKAPLRYAALSPRDPINHRSPAPRAMPLIKDLRSLLDADTPFRSTVSINVFGKLLTTDTTTRTLVFADLRHPEVVSIGPFMEKPQRVLKRTFGQGFQSELRTDRFTGAAVGVIKSIFTP